MKKLHFTVTVLLASLCVKVAAGPVVPLKDLPFYWGIGYSWADVTVTEAPATNEFNMEAVTGRFGYHFSEEFSTEIRYSKSLKVTHVNGNAVELDHVYGAYAKVNLLTDIDFTPYAIVGYSQGRLSTSASVEEEGVSYGIGVDFCQDHPVCMNAEYMAYLDEDIIEYSAISLGLRFNF